MLTLDADWLAAISTAIAAGAALLAYGTTRQANSIVKRQTAIGVIQEILEDYSSQNMYDALRRFGDFVADDPDHKERFERITRIFEASQWPVDLEMKKNEDFLWAVNAIERCPNLRAARRQIHHHFKRVWALRRAEVLSDQDLLLLTSETAAYELWRDKVLPVTVALSKTQESRGLLISTADRWARELTCWVDAANKQPSSTLPRLTAPARNVAFFLALFSTALAMGAALAHALELPNKITLSREDYFVVQGIYSGWNRLGYLLAIQLAGMLGVVVLYRRQRRVLIPAIAAVGCLLAAQAVFWIFTFPANQATADWTLQPETWESLRRQWEYSHLAGAILQTLAMASLIIAALARCSGSRGSPQQVRR